MMSKNWGSHIHKRWKYNAFIKQNKKEKIASRNLSFKGVSWNSCSEKCCKNYRKTLALKLLLFLWKSRLLPEEFWSRNERLRLKSLESLNLLSYQINEVQQICLRKCYHKVTFVLTLWKGIVSTPGNYMKLRYCSQCFSRHFFKK